MRLSPSSIVKLLTTSTLSKVLCATFIPLTFGVGCLELDNKPKDPLVVRDGFLLSGYAIGTEGSLERGDARITMTLTSSNSVSSFRDTLARDQNGDLIAYQGTQWRYNSEQNYYTQRNSASRIMLPNADTNTFVTMDRQELAMGLFSPIGDIPDDETTSVTPPDLTTSDYMCVSLEDQLDGSGDPDPDEPFLVRTYTAHFYNSNEATLTSTTPGESVTTKMLGYEFSDDKILKLTDAAEDAALLEVFDDVIENECDAVNVVDEDYNIFSEVPWICEVDVASFGGASEDGGVVQFSQVAYLKRTPDAELFEGTKYASSTECNADETAPCSHPVGPVEPESDLETLDDAWKQRIEWNICVRKASTPVSNADLSGTYWIGTLIRDNDENSMILSEYTADGEGSGVHSQINVTNDVALREYIMDYNVDSDGELVIDGRYGALSEDGSLFIYDASKPSQNIQAISIGLRQTL